ncbi:MAG: bifunctional riboflavin kinase/FAD synthetase [Ruminococcaceae bacterium]|nr:bifunctional riboflavin kinase/FAD synthetase [Oscillospiraceae bacterium]
MKATSIALGFFDGVHIAHQKIIKSAVDFANENSLTPIALSFDKSPLEILCPEKVRYITTLEGKQEIIEKLGAKAEFLTVSKDLLNMSPEDFIEKILVNKYNVKHIVCGYDYRFGKGGKGDTELLCKMGENLGFTVEILDCEVLWGEKISSSRIRELISEGNIESANELIGRNFSLSGEVCEGKHLGRKLGFPTANVFFGKHTIIPKNGVYKTIVTVKGNGYPAITNTGINPTVGGEALRTETYIPDFEGNLYGEKINIEFIGFIREEKKFDNIEELKKQIQADVSSL